ncbi:MAG: sigma-70 family RNA polymerase sigma factor [Acidimicrobiia bacterium]|nr:sigma-70 family RNA polymerase sigma factor [Acidimicrobiia bacterium]
MRRPRRCHQVGSPDSRGLARQGGGPTGRLVPRAGLSSRLEETLRIEGGRVLATLIRLTGDFQFAEDALHDAIVVALEKWPSTGTPPNPAGWLTTTARRRALDRIRREGKRTAKEAEAMRLLDVEPVDPPDGRDDRLRLLFTSCHPALNLESRVALALRTIGGLTTEEIARAFLVTTPTMGQRISRAKKKIATAHIPYRVPDDHELPDRLPAVLAAVYLIFTTGHHAAAGRLDSRVDLAGEAIRLARLLAELMPDVDECAGLLALVLATGARQAARVDNQGDLVLLDEQDRSRWDHEAIAEAEAIVAERLRRGAQGPYVLQAAIACAHGTAPTAADTDWQLIAALYRRLEAVLPTPVVRVNRAVAEAQAGGPAAGLAVLDSVEGAAGWHLYWAARAAFLTQLDRTVEAADAYRVALGCDMNDSDRSFIESRLAALATND